jgi:hypothetical protein
MEAGEVLDQAELLPSQLEAAGKRLFDRVG